MRHFSSNGDPTHSSRPPSSGVRGAIDSLVQGALVELFSAYSVALAPTARQLRSVVPSLPEVSGSVGFTAPKGQGRVTLSLPAAVMNLMPASAGRAAHGDWVRELTNQLIGRIKNRLLQFNVRLLVGISVSVDSAELVRALVPSPGLRIYQARTLRGGVIVTAEGLPNESELVWVGQSNLRAEGDMILF